MTKFENIIRLEKERDYAVENKDLFVFSTLMQISQEQASRRLKRRLIIGSILCTIIIFIITQIMYLSNLNFSGVMAMFEHFNNEYPYMIAIGNLGFVIILVTAKKLKLI